MSTIPNKIQAELRFGVLEKVTLFHTRDPSKYPLLAREMKLLVVLGACLAYNSIVNEPTVVSSVTWGASMLFQGCSQAAAKSVMAM